MLRAGQDGPCLDVHEEPQPAGAQPRRGGSPAQGAVTVARAGAVCQMTACDRVTEGATGAGTVTQGATASTVSTTYVQRARAGMVVVKRLCDDKCGAGRTVLRVEWCMGNRAWGGARTRGSRRRGGPGTSSWGGLSEHLRLGRLMAVLRRFL